MSEVTRAVQDYFDKIKAQLSRSVDMLAYVKDAFDKVVPLIENPPPPARALRARIEQFICIKTLAPVDKIIECLAGGGIVCADIGTPAQWIATGQGKTGIVKVQIMSCTKVSASVLYTGGTSGTLTNPAKFVLAGVLLWVGG